MSIYKIVHNGISNKATRRRFLSLFKFVPSKLYLKITYRIRTGESLNLKNPKTYNEKLQWLKLYDRNPIYTKMVDKYEAKEYVADALGKDYSIPTLGVWNNVDDIDFNELPNQFVLKCTHDSGTYVICKDKSTFDIDAAKKHLKKALKLNYYLIGREWPYKNVPRRIIAEAYMQEKDFDGNPEDNVLTDYKFFCFNGKPEIMYVSKDTAAHTTTDFFDMKFEHLPIRMKDPNSSPDLLPSKPECFEEMVEVSKKLSAGIPQLRVDFYIINNQLYVGELTLFHMSGFALISPKEWGEKLGGLIILPEKR